MSNQTSATGSGAQLRRIILNALIRIERDKAYTDIVLSHRFLDSNLDQRDRAFVSNVVRGTVKWQKRYDWMTKSLYQGKFNNMPLKIRIIMRQAFYQIEHMRTPSFAVVNESVELAKRSSAHKWAGTVNGMLRTYLRKPEAIRFPDASRQPVEYLATQYSYPEWLVKRWINVFGFEEAEQLCKANNKAPLLSVRRNALAINKEDFENILSSANASFTTSIVPNYYQLDAGQFELQKRLLDQGLATVQDESAGLAGLLANPQPDQTIFDLCAAPGGKSVHMAELTNDKARIFSGDVNVSRTRMVQAAVQRLGLRRVYPLCSDASHFPARQADMIVLDAPCSGLGVLRKKPDMRWQRSEQEIDTLVKLQKQLMNSASRLVRHGGTLLYGTCTIEKRENEEIVFQFLENHPQFTIDRTSSNVPTQFTTADGFVRTFPHRDNMDGSLPRN